MDFDLLTSELLLLRAELEEFFTVDNGSSVSIWSTTGQRDAGTLGVSCDDGVELCLCLHLRT